MTAEELVEEKLEKDELTFNTGVLEIFDFEYLDPDSFEENNIVYGVFNTMFDYWIEAESKDEAFDQFLEKAKKDELDFGDVVPLHLEIKGVTTDEEEPDDLDEGYVIYGDL